MVVEDLQAGPDRCQEASTLSSEKYIPCNAPAKWIVSHPGRDERPYRMCEECAAHNTHNRGAKIDGPYVPGAEQTGPVVVTPSGQLLDVRTHADLPDITTTITARVDALAKAIEANAFQLTPEDAMVLSDATDLQVSDADDYTRGFALMHELGALRTRIKDHYGFYKNPLNRLVGIVRGLESGIGGEVDGAKSGLQRACGAWKVEQDRLAQVRAVEEQRLADEKAAAENAERAAALQRAAAEEPNPNLAAMLADTAQKVANAPAKAAPVAVVSAAPKVPGHTRKNNTAKVDDVMALLKAHVEGKCHLPEDVIAEALQPFLNQQARNLGDKIALAFPGTSCVTNTIGVATKRR